MWLTESEIQGAIACVKAAFPRFAKWKHHNEAGESYSGFALWGEFVPDPTDRMRRTFFITFSADRTSWTGHLTIGQHSYLWSSADFGDAHLVDTKPCATLEEAISALKSQMENVFAALSGS